MLKRCSRCKADKSEDDFQFRCKVKGIRRSHCKACMSKHHKAYYKSSPTRRIRIKEVKRERARQNRLYVQGYLRTHPCVDCGEQDVVVLDFDHVRGVKHRRMRKSRGIRTLVHEGVSLKVLKAEIAKCDVRCANDHRRVTAKRAGWFAA